MSVFISLLCDTGTFVSFMYFLVSLHQNKNDFLMDEFKVFWKLCNNLLTMRINDF